MRLYFLCGFIHIEIFVVGVYIQVERKSIDFVMSLGKLREFIYKFKLILRKDFRIMITRYALFLLGVMAFQTNLVYSMDDSRGFTASQVAGHSVEDALEMLADGYVMPRDFKAEAARERSRSKSGDTSLKPKVPVAVAKAKAKEIKK
jgi:hypothetical protein